MKQFMDEDFLLESGAAKTLYHGYAEKMPIIDYHCHIDPRAIAENRKFDNISQVWLGGDHYKWRLIRANGVAEPDITGRESSDREKFQKFAEVLPKTIGNPMYHWTHLELKRYFGYDGILNADTAEVVWNLCNAKLKTDALSVRGIIDQSNVRLICTTDDPVDDLRWHKVIRDDPTCRVRVLPAWRPDKIINIEKPGFAAYAQSLEKASGVAIRTVQDVCRALRNRMDFFGGLGCKASDHGLNYVMYAPADEAALNNILGKGLAGKPLIPEETDEYKYALLVFLAGEYAKRGWVMQLHYGTNRDPNTAMFNRLGPDTGFDVIATHNAAGDLARFLNALYGAGALPKTVVYSLNPNDNEMIDSVLGSFQGTEIAGKLQHGAAWWYNDTKTGMVAQMTSFANLSVFGNFIGMLTDSRSFLSYTRHEYFRRILCNLVGSWVENGEYPWDEKTLGGIVKDISFRNANRYFGFGLDEN